MDVLSYETKQKLKAIKMPESRIRKIEVIIQLLTESGLVEPTLNTIAYKDAENLIDKFKTDGELRGESILSLLDGV